MNDTDVLERLSRANPLPDDPAPPPIDALLERLDEVLREPRGRKRLGGSLGLLGPFRRRLVLAAAAGGAVAVLALVASSPDGGTPNVAAEMFKATEPGTGVLHMSTLTEKIVGAQVTTTREQWWSEQNPRTVRFTIDDGEETIESMLTTKPMKLLRWEQSQPDTISESVPTDVASSEQTGVQILRELYQKGELTNAGRSTVGGREAWLLEVHPQYTVPTLDGKQLPNPVVAIDASTFEPLELTTSDVTTEHGRPELLVTKERWLAYEELPRNAQDEALLTLAAHPGATIKSEG